MDNLDIISLMSPGLRVGMCQTVATLMSALWLELLLVRRRKPWVQIMNYCYSILVMNWLMNGPLKMYYGEQLWWQFLYSLMTLVNVPLNMAVFYYTFDGGLLKTTLASVIVDVVVNFHGMAVIILVNILEGRENIFQCSGDFMAEDLLIAAICAASFAVLRYWFGGMVKKFRTWQTRHKSLWWGALVLYFSVAYAGRFIELVSGNGTYLIIILQWPVSTVIVGGSAFLIFRMHQKNVERKNDYLKTKGNLLKAHYIILQQQIRHIERSRARNNEKMEKILQMQDEWRGEGLENYLKDLKRQYANIEAGIYCNDWAVDAMLTNLAALCRKKEIRPDFQFQKYDRGEIREEDILQFLRSFGESTIRASKEGDVIKLQAAAVRNQLVFTCTCPAGKRISEKDYRELMKKYQGSFQGSVKGNAQMVSVMLQREEI